MKQSIKVGTNKHAANDEIINLKFERMESYIDASLFKCKSDILKWVFGLSIAESVFNFALRIWGL